MRVTTRAEEERRRYDFRCSTADFTGKLKIALTVLLPAFTSGARRNDVSM